LRDSLLIAAALGSMNRDAAAALIGEFGVSRRGLAGPTQRG